MPHPSSPHRPAFLRSAKPRLGFEGRRVELRLRLLGLLQELLSARALLAAAAGEEECRGNHEGEEPDHGAGIGTGRTGCIPSWYVQRVDEALTEQVRTAMPYAATLGLEVIAASKDEVHAAVEWEERLTTAAGILHGGVLMGLADTTGAYCAYLNLPEGSTATATIESKTNFFAAVRSGRVEARSRPLHRGSRTIVVETDLFDEGGKHVARVTQTQAVL